MGVRAGAVGQTILDRVCVRMGHVYADKKRRKAKVRYLQVGVPDQVPALQTSGGDFQVSSRHGRVSRVGLSQLQFCWLLGQLWVLTGQFVAPGTRRLPAGQDRQCQKLPPVTS